jgi:adenosylcobinamide-GDP ribazoletransferase
VIAIGLQIAAKLVLLAAVVQSARVPLLALVLVAAWARWGTLAIGAAVPPLTEGSAGRLAAGIGTPMVALEAAALAGLSLLAAPVLIAALPIAGGLAFYWRRRLGGMTGDCHGASIEVTESLLLFALLLA